MFFFFSEWKIASKVWWKMSVLLEKFKFSILLPAPSIEQFLSQRITLFGSSLFCYRKRISLPNWFISIWVILRIPRGESHNSWGWKGHLKGHLHHLHGDHGAQTPVPPDFQCSHGWGIHHLSWQPVPVHVALMSQFWVSLSPSGTEFCFSPSPVPLQ